MRKGIIAAATLGFSLLARAITASAFTVGNSTPATIYFVQGQGFTPAISGNAGTGVPRADANGNAYLRSVQIAFAPGQTPPATLYIYSALPTDGNAATGTGSIGFAASTGGGLYVFNPPLQVPFSTPTFAVLPACASIFDAPDSYAGGTDLYPVGCPAPGSNPIVEGTYDTGFTATFTEPPSVVPALTPGGVALLILGLLASSLLLVGRRPS